jgi:hypothetical protein
MARRDIQFCAGRGGMSYSDDRDMSGLRGFPSRVLNQLRELSQLSWGIIVAVAAFTLIFAWWAPTPPLNRVVNAAPFVWPKGCRPINYDVDGLEISCSCKDKGYRIADARQRGLPQSRGPDDWYRLDKDAVNIYLSSGAFSDGKCYRGGEIRYFFDTIKR